MSERFIGIDIGAETIKVVELTREGSARAQAAPQSGSARAQAAPQSGSARAQAAPQSGSARAQAAPQSGSKLRWTRRAIVEHQKDPGTQLLRTLSEWDWDGVKGAAVAGRLSRQVDLQRIPTQQAQSRGYRYLHTDTSATIVSIGSHGFSVLELRPSGTEVFRENSRCSQGTGNFLRQLVERFDLSIEEASQLCEGVEDPAPLSGRCPVILKTDMTHLANKGEGKARILAGLYDAVCENVQVLIKPSTSPPKVVLLGGVSRSRRVCDRFRGFLARHDMVLAPTEDDDALFFEAVGSAAIAADQPADVPALDALLVDQEEANLELVPSLKGYLKQVTRMPVPPKPVINGKPRQLVLGFDIGSTGSKVVALDVATQEAVWEGYVSTSGNPVGAAQQLAQQFVDGPASHYDVLAMAATGSGREIVGSLIATCYGPDAVYVLNEIAAHAAGATHYDPRVDTIFEIGGQDAKYIRLADGRVVDAAMNEACSAGTGSFIEEQGRKFAGIEDVVQLGQEALGADSGVSLGQHCSVFMAEIIDEAVAAGKAQRSIIAGIYDSIIQNYLNRVKGSRSVGQVIFCQGMPFSADALAAAVARQTGAEVIIPPNPGNIGALGISLLAVRELELAQRPRLCLNRLLNASLEKKETFVCKSTKGCGGAGNKCRIDRITTLVEDKRQRFTWGGGCSLYDKGTRKRKLPDRAPDPFREREELVHELIARVSQPRGNKVVALTDEFMLKGLLPFFATFIHELGFDLDIQTGADQALLKRGIEAANVPFCAPMQLYHGLVGAMAERKPDYLFLPMLRGLPKTGQESCATLCPIVQASPDMLRWDLGRDLEAEILSPVVDFDDDGLEGETFRNGCKRFADELGLDGRRFSIAFRTAVAAHNRFDARLMELGKRALQFCEESSIVPVVVLGRAYTLHNRVLNSNVPSILREQGAIGIPVDCYPINDDVPVFDDIYWGYGQRILRAAHQVRRTPGLYSTFCSNYSCGPDSFNLHFFSYIMDGKPFSIIETDGHSGDAGTKTRIEAFLYCVHEDLQSGGVSSKRPNALKLIELDKEGMKDIQRRDEVVLVPRMGAGAASLAACLRGIGIRAECLPEPDRETVRIGRRYTSGKECVPMCITLGSLLQRLEQDRDSEERFAFFMPTAQGPCRFGVYNLLHKITLERLEWKDRVRVWSPLDTDYFEGIPAGFSALVFAGFMGHDLLLEALYDVRPVETRPGAAEEIFKRYHVELLRMLEERGRGDLSVASALLEATSGRLFGVMDLVKRAAHEFAAVKGDEEKPTVLVVGEIYVRLDPFTNDFIVNKLERRGMRVRFAPFTEWLEYTDVSGYLQGDKSGMLDKLKSMLQGRIQQSAYDAVAKVLGWPKRTTVKASLEAAAPYVRKELMGEAVLTVGGPTHEWREGLIDGVVSVGPLECMPNKISEAQFFHVAEQEGLPSLTLALNGDPLDPEIVDNFAFEVHTQYRERTALPEHSQAWFERTRRRWEAFKKLAGEFGRRPQPFAPVVVEERFSEPAHATKGENGSRTPVPEPLAARRSEEIEIS